MDALWRRPRIGRWWWGARITIIYSQGGVAGKEEYRDEVVKRPRCVARDRECDLLSTLRGRNIVSGGRWGLGGLSLSSTSKQQARLSWPPASGLGGGFYVHFKRYVPVRLAWRGIGSPEGAQRRDWKSEQRWQDRKTEQTRSHDPAYMRLGGNIVGFS